MSSPVLPCWIPWRLLTVKEAVELLHFTRDFWHAYARANRRCLPEETRSSGIL